MATPKIIIDMMLMDKYHWTPQQIDDIPKTYLEMMMMAINQKYATEAGIEKIRELEAKTGIGGKKKDKIIGSSIREKRPIR